MDTTLFHMTHPTLGPLKSDRHFWRRHRHFWRRHRHFWRIWLVGKWRSGWLGL